MHLNGRKEAPSSSSGSRDDKLLDDESDCPGARVVVGVFVRSARVMVTPSEDTSRHLSEPPQQYLYSSTLRALAHLMTNF